VDGQVEARFPVRRRAGELALALLILALPAGAAAAGRAPAPGAASPGTPRDRPIAESGPARSGYVVLDATRVYHGDPRSFTRPAVLVMDDVFRVIPEYRQLIDEAIAASDARYWILLEQANKRFARVVREVAALGGYDLVAERAAVAARDAAVVVPDVTADAVRIVRAG